MITRTYNAPDLQVQDQREVRGGQVERNGGTGAPIQFGDDSWRANLIGQLGGTLAKTLDQAADIEYSNLYLEGQAKAGLIESEAEIEGNPLTRDWQVAGYRDTMGKLSLADTEAQFAIDIKDLRTKGPEEMQQYLNARRQKLLPGLSSMSREARAASMGQLLLQDRAATKTWSSERTAFIIDEQRQAAHTQWNTTLGNMHAAQVRMRMGDVTQEAFDEQLRSAAGVMVGSVWMNQRLPADVKQNLAFEMIQSTLSNDSVELYDYLERNGIPDGKGGSTSMLAMLDGAQQNKLATQYREAKSRTNDARNYSELVTIKAIEAQIDAGKYTGTTEELQESLEPSVASGTISGERAAGLVGKLITKRYETDEDSTKAALANSGSAHAAWLAGYSSEEVVDAADKQAAKLKLSPPERLGRLLDLGEKWGAPAYKRVGEMLAPVLRQVRNSKGEIDPAALQTFTAIRTATEQAVAAGNLNAQVQIMQGLSEQDRVFANRVFRHNAEGKSLEEAVGLATDLEAKEAAMSPSARGAVRAQTEKAAIAELGNIEPVGLLGSIWGHVKSTVSADAAAELKLRPESTVSFRDGIFGDGPVVKLYAQSATEAVSDEIGRILDLNPYTDAQDAVSTAKTNVAARTVSTRHGPVILPHGSNVAGFFGVSAANLPVVGPALDKVLQETKKDARWHVKHTHNGVFAQELDKDGKPIGSGQYLNPKDIGKAAKSIMDARQAEGNARYGSGREIPAGGGAKIRYNGNSSSGAPAAWMLAYRDNLVAQEGIRTDVYDDGTGVLTTGIGVSKRNPHFPTPGPDGKVAAEDVRTSFIKASEDAAKAGMRHVKDVSKGNRKLENQHTFALMSEIAYQSGVNFATVQKDGKLTKGAVQNQLFLKALASGDTARAVELFKTTPAWYYSVDPKKRNTEAGKTELTKRRQHYLDLITKSIQGA